MKVTVDLYGLLKSGDKRSAFQVMTDLGFSWERHESQGIADQVVFYGVRHELDPGFEHLRFEREDKR